MQAKRMKLLDYLKGLDKAGMERMAANCRTSVGQLKQVAYGNRPASAVLAVAVERATAGAVTRQDLRDDWADIWPELSAPAAGVESSKQAA